MTESSIGGAADARDGIGAGPAGVPAGGRPGTGAATTSERILDAALASFATRGYDASSLDALAAGLEIRKQTILYWFPSKEVLLEAVIDRSAIELSAALEASLARAGTGWSRVEAVVRSVFRLAARRPELVGLVREMGRTGTPAATRLVVALEPLVGPGHGVPRSGDGRRPHAAPRAEAAAAGHLLHGDRHAHRGRGAAGLRRGAHRPVAGAPEERDPRTAALGAGHRARA